MFIYISFGYGHYHVINGVEFDKETLCKIECQSHNQGRDIAINAFGLAFCTSYESPVAEQLAKHYNWKIVDLPDPKSWGGAMLRAATKDPNPETPVGESLDSGEES